MAHKTFISYKYSEALELRNKIIEKLGNDATYYKGETSKSPSLTDYTTSTIRSKLADMIFDTTVMIVIVSPNMTSSDWMEWEIKYALREQSRNGRTSHANGVVCVVQKDKYAYYTDPYSWAKNGSEWASWKLFDIINKNRNNKKSWIESDIKSDEKSKYDALSQNYVDIIEEDEFLKYPLTTIDKTFDKSQNLGSYNLSKQ